MWNPVVTKTEIKLYVNYTSRKIELGEDSHFKGAEKIFQLQVF